MKFPIDRTVYLTLASVFIISLITIIYKSAISHALFDPKFVVMGRGYIDEKMSFNDQTYNASKWEWDFGDHSAHAFEKNPVHSYKMKGTYLVSLVINDKVEVTRDINIRPKPIEVIHVMHEPVKEEIEEEIVKPVVKKTVVKKTIVSPPPITNSEWKQLFIKTANESDKTQRNKDYQELIKYFLDSKTPVIVNNKTATTFTDFYHDMRDKHYTIYNVLLKWDADNAFITKVNIYLREAGNSKGI